MYIVGFCKRLRAFNTLCSRPDIRKDRLVSIPLYHFYRTSWKVIHLYKKYLEAPRILGISELCHFFQQAHATMHTNMD